MMKSLLTSRMFFSRYDYEHTTINMDRTSLVLHCYEVRIGKFGYSRDHLPDKTNHCWRYRTFRPDTYPNWDEIEPGNLNNQTHFKKRYQQMQPAVNGSLVIFDKGANRIANTQMIRADNLQYITGKNLKKSDDKTIAEIETCNNQVIDEESGTRGIKLRC